MIKLKFLPRGLIDYFFFRFLISCVLCVLSLFVGKPPDPVRFEGTIKMNDECVKQQVDISKYQS